MRIYPEVNPIEFNGTSLKVSVYWITALFKDNKSKKLEKEGDGFTS